MAAANLIEIPAELKTPSSAYAWSHVALVVVPLYALLFAGYWLAANTSYPWLALLTLPFLGAQIYKITIIMHDCCHGTMLANRKLNDALGVAGGYFVGADFDTFRRTHWKHHAKFGENDDPQGDDYLHLDMAPRLRLVWHILRPLVGYNLFKVFLFGASAPGTASRPATRKERFTLLLGIGVVQLSIAATATGFGQVWWTVLLYPIAAATWGLFFSQTRGFAEHVAMPGQNPVHARTHTPNWFDKLFFYNLNFNYHIEHHEFPGVPSCHLPRIHEAMRQQDKLPDVSASIVSTIFRRLRSVPTS